MKERRRLAGLAPQVSRVPARVQAKTPGEDPAREASRQLDPYLVKRENARTVPAPGANGAGPAKADTLQTKPLPGADPGLDARLARARLLGHQVTAGHLGSRGGSSGQDG